MHACWVRFLQFSLGLYFAGLLALQVYLFAVVLFCKLCEQQASCFAWDCSMLHAEQRRCGTLATQSVMRTPAHRQYTHELSAVRDGLC